MSKDIELGNLYDFNKGLVKKAGQLSSDGLLGGFEKIKQYMLANYKYFMLLSNERRDYTVFNLSPMDTGITEAAVSQAAKDVIDCMQNRGAIYSINKNGTYEGIEIWIKVEQEMFVYYLFAYDAAVIEAEV